MTIMTSKEAEEAKKPKILQRHKDSLRICFFSSFLCLLCCCPHLDQFFQLNPQFICHLFQFYFTKVFHCLVLFPLLSLNVLFLVFHCLVLFLLLSLNVLFLVFLVKNLSITAGFQPGIPALPPSTHSFENFGPSSSTSP